MSLSYCCTELLNIEDSIYNPWMPQNCSINGKINKQTNMFCHAAEKSSIVWETLIPDICGGKCGIQHQRILNMLSNGCTFSSHYWFLL